jgi:hypothetical protein
MKNIFKKKSSLSSYPGNFNCICNNPNSYQNCSKSLEHNETLPQNVYFLFHPFIKLNEPHSFLLVVEKLGNVMTTIEISTKDFVLLNRQLSHNSYGEFRKTTREKFFHLMRKMEINFAEFPHENLLLLTFESVLANPGSQWLRVVLKRYIARDEDLQPVTFNSKYFNILVHKNEDYCMPTIQFPSCSNALSPRQVLLHEVNVFKPIVTSLCNQKSSLSYKWSIEHFVHQKTMLSLPNEGFNFLILPAYTLWFNDAHDIFSQYYTIKLIVFEEDRENRKSGMGISRCYINVVVPSPEVRLKFGRLRKASFERTLVLDASNSIDVGAKSPNLLQFSWKCSSVNDFCKKFASSGILHNY